MAYLPYLIPRSGIEFTINRLGLPNPKFKIGDRIQHRYICDDKLDKENYLKLNILRGVILWMLPDTKLKQWQYFVLWDDQNPEYFVFDSPDTEDHFEPSWENFTAPRGSSTKSTNSTNFKNYVPNFYRN